MVAQKFLDCGLHLSAGHELNRGSHDRDLFLLFSLHGDISPSAHPILSEGRNPTCFSVPTWHLARSKVLQRLTYPVLCLFTAAASLWSAARQNWAQADLTSSPALPLRLAMGSSVPSLLASGSVSVPGG